MSKSSRILTHFAPLLLLVSALTFQATSPAAGQTPSGSLGAAGTSDGKAPLQEDSVERDYAEQLPRIAPTDPAHAPASFQIHEDFRIELVAAEPLVTDPVAMAFDDSGRLFVVEMRGYSEDAHQNLGVVRLLEDTDQDGTFDKSTPFAEGLSWPTAVACYDGGVFVADAPDVFYLKDTDGDGRADQRSVTFTGFGRDNVQGLLNSFQWSPDNRIHAATSSSGASVSTPSRPDAEPLDLRGRDFAWNPRTMEIEATSGGAQHGLSFDRWGRKFVCSNSDHIQLVEFEDRYVARNPHMAARGPRRSIAEDGPAADVFRISPVEPWRIVRTRLRVKGLVPGPIEGGGTAAGYFTSATGVTVYRGDAFPPSFRDSVFVGDVGSNLVHRKLLVTEGLRLTARRADVGREFLASNDIWFRPVQFSNAPDGTLYIADMYREVIEHPASLPPLIKKHLDLTSGRDRGRIYRILPKGFKQPTLPPLRAMSPQQWVGLLDHPNAWHRETAQRLLFESNPPQAVEPLLKHGHHGKSPEGRIAAIYLLRDMKVLTPGWLAPCLDDPHPRVREQAIRAAESLAREHPSLADRIAALADDDDPHVRLQAAFTLGEFPPQRRVAPLARLAQRDSGESLIEVAIQSSLADGADAVLAELVRDTAYRSASHGRHFLAELARQIGARRDQHEQDHLLEAIMPLPDEDAALAGRMLAALLQGAGSNRTALRQALTTDEHPHLGNRFRDILRQAADLAVDSTQPVERRAEAIEALGCGPYGEISPTLIELLGLRHPPQIQQAVLRSLASTEDPLLAESLLDAWQQLSPALRAAALDILLTRKGWSEAVLGAIETQRLPVSEIDPVRVRALTSHPDEAIRKRAETVLGLSAGGSRGEVLEDYRFALHLDGNIDRGRQTFRRICAACHRLEDYGHEVGLNLGTIRNRGPETILISVLDPNREVDPRFLTYLVETTDGRILTGIIDAETATTITLKRAENLTDTIQRVDIDSLRSTGLSIMPEGLEKEIDPQALADLIAYLMSVE